MVYVYCGWFGDVLFHTNSMAELLWWLETLPQHHDGISLETLTLIDIMGDEFSAVEFVTLAETKTPMILM